MATVKLDEAAGAAAGDPGRSANLVVVDGRDEARLALSAVRKLRASRQPRPVLLLVACLDGECLRLGRAAGVADYLVSPWTEAEAMARVEALTRPAEPDAAGRQSDPDDTATLQTVKASLVYEIIERGRAHRAVKDLNLTLEAILQASPLPIVVLDSAMRVELWTPAAERTFGWLRHEVIGRPYPLLLPGQTGQLGAAFKALSLDEGEGKDPSRRARKDGTILHVSTWSAPLARGDGSAPAVVEILLDVTERIRLTNLLAAAEEGERRRISRDLHDQVGQTLMALRLSLATLQKSLAGDPAVQARIDSMLGLTADLGSDLHRVVCELRPTQLDDLGLVDALVSDVETWTQRWGIAVTVLDRGLHGRRLPAAVESAFYRIAREALTNIARHSQARHASLVLDVRADSARLVIEDDGQGFEPKPTSRVGLLGIKERALLLGGSCEVESAAGRGTALFVQIPLEDWALPAPGAAKLRAPAGPGPSTARSCE